MSSKPLKNPRHEAFCRAYVATGVARHAYLAAGYQARLGADLNGTYPADTCASRLLKHAKVESRIERLRQAMAKRADVTEESILDELEQARTIAASERQPSAMVSASVAKAKLVGLMIDRKEVGDAGDFSKMSEQELIAYLADSGVAGLNKPMADSNGVVVDTVEDSLPTPADLLPAATHNGPTRKQ